MIVQLVAVLFAFLAVLCLGKLIDISGFEREARKYARKENA